MEEIEKFNEKPIDLELLDRDKFVAWYRMPKQSQEGQFVTKYDLICGKCDAPFTKSDFHYKRGNCKNCNHAGSARNVAYSNKAMQFVEGYGFEIDDDFKEAGELIHREKPYIPFSCPDCGVNVQEVTYRTFINNISKGKGYFCNC